MHHGSVIQPSYFFFLISFRSFSDSWFVSISMECNNVNCHVRVVFVIRYAMDLLLLLLLLLPPFHLLEFCFEFTSIFMPSMLNNNNTQSSDHWLPKPNGTVNKNELWIEHNKTQWTRRIRKEMKMSILFTFRIFFFHFRSRHDDLLVSYASAVVCMECVVFDVVKALK